MMEKLIAMYEKGGITADHLVAECLRLIDPQCPELVLGALPPEVLERMLKYVNDFRPRRMRSNYGIQPAADQIEAAKHWIEAKVAS
ncbi:MAG: hypothetical protein HY040_14745 [Planctomycetes bacterium]|nr:hypothetical protein [Planctomycetota bacterium]